MSAAQAESAVVEEKQERKQSSPEANVQHEYSTPPPPVDNAIYNVDKWYQENEPLFAPPICNKMMYNQQLKVMFVGGPNTRKDFHVDCGEEFFFQMRGNISLPIYEQGIRQNIDIKEGEVFLLPACIPHSPQRPEKGSLGLVIERTRVETLKEMDGLRYYYGDKADQVLWEKWFFCTDLGTQLKPIVEEYMASEECKTQKPGKNVLSELPVELDTKSKVNRPFPLQKWIEEHWEQMKREKVVPVFSGTQTTVRIITGPVQYRNRFDLETWVYVLKGEGVKITFDKRLNRQRREECVLAAKDCLLVNSSEQYQLEIADNSAQVMTVTMAPHDPFQ